MIHLIGEMIFAKRSHTRRIADSDPVRKCQAFGSAFHLRAYFAIASGES